MKYIPLIIHEIEFEFTRSRGAGGQHVNRTNSASLISWKPAETNAFDPDRKARLVEKLSRYLTVEGAIIVRSEEFREQAQNKKKSLEKLDRLIEQAFFVPKKRIATKPSRSAKRKRVDEKKHRSGFKETRRRVSED